MNTEKAKNSLVIMQQTVCFPVSAPPVLQQPSRKNPVTGDVEQGLSSSPKTFRLGYIFNCLSLINQALDYIPLISTYDNEAGEDVSDGQQVRHIH